MNEVWWEGILLFDVIRTARSEHKIQSDVERTANTYAKLL